MFQKSGKEQGGNPSGLTADLSNRILLFTMGAFVLVVFMDVQARNHYRNIMGGRGTPPKAGITKNSPRYKKPADERAVSKRNSSSRQDILPEDLELPIDMIPSVDSAEEFPPDLEVPMPITGSVDAILHSLEANTIANNKSERVPPTSSIAIPRRVNLYYIRYKGKQSRIEMVQRTLPEKQRTVALLLETLQNGPTPAESGLLNAFDSSIKIRSLSLSGGVVVLDISSRFEKMSPGIVQDRLDQLLLTLMSVPGVKGVHILIDGQQRDSLAGGKIPLERIMGIPDRKVYEYKDEI